MRRRELVAGIAAAALLPLAVRAQGAESARRMSILVAEAIENDPYYENPIAGIRQALRDLGWIEGQDDALIRGRGRYTDDFAPQPALHALVLRSPHTHAKYIIAPVGINFSSISVSG